MMIRVTVDISDDALTQQVQITPSSITQALKMVREGKPARPMRLLFPIDLEAIFVPESTNKRRQHEMDYTGIHRANELTASAKGGDRQWKQR
jgi:hypothetical protein